VADGDAIVTVTSEDGLMSVAYVGEPRPSSELEGDLVCHVRFEGGPWDGRATNVPVIAAVASFAAHDFEVRQVDGEDQADGW
jgi:hypothetical protein